MADAQAQRGGWKSKLEEEMQALALIALYIFFTLQALRLYRAFIEGRDPFDGLEMGATAIEALVIAKVIILGDLLKISHKYLDRPALVPTLYRALLFAVFILIFSSLELFVKGLIHGLGAATSFQDVLNKERGIRLAQAAFMFLAGIPLFATWEISRHIGERTLVEIFLGKKRAE